jgi:hypothetical protein
MTVPPPAAPAPAAPPSVPHRLTLGAIRVITGGLGLAAVALSGGDGPVTDAAVLIGILAALGTAWFPLTPAPWLVLAAALLPRLQGPGGVDAEVLAQAVVLLLFQASAGLLPVLEPAQSVELRALVPGLRRCAGAVLAVSPAALLVLDHPAVPETVAAGCAGAAAVVLVLLVRGVGAGGRPSG